jgi:Skp family chaperone for outer membrane proteins
MTKYTINLVFAGVLAALALGPFSDAAAQAASGANNPPLVVAVLDIQQIMQVSKAAKALKAAMDKQTAAYQAELAQQENALRNAEQQLMQQRAALPADQFEQKHTALAQKEDALRQTSDKRRQQLQEMYYGGITQIEQVLRQVTAEIAKEKGITLVLTKSSVLLNATNYEITAAALQKVDARLPTVKLTAPQ